MSEAKSQGAKLFIGQLPRGADESSIREITETFGEVVDISIVKDKATGQSKGCAFVKFSAMSFAENCRNTLHGKTPFDEGNPLQVRFANGEAERLGIPEHILNSQNSKDCKLFVGGLPRNHEFDEDALRTLFSSFGELTYHKMFFDEHNNFKGAAFVSFASKEQAFSAIDALHQKHVIAPMERPIQVKFADPAAGKRDQNGGGRGAAPNNYGNQSFSGRPQANTGYAQQGPPPPPPTQNRTIGAWTEYFTGEGRPYYHNARQNVTQWEKPAEFAQPPQPSSVSYPARHGNGGQRYQPY